MNDIEIFAICVCTHKRPNMLMRCLLSLAEQNRHPHWKFIFIIIDNESEPNNQSIAQEFEQITGSSVKYIHQPLRGISIARNTALEEALRQGADWIASFDDDQYADKNAIVAAYQAAQDSQAKVASMRILYLHGDPAIQQRMNSRLIFGGTGGCLFNTYLIRSDGLSLRFDEATGLGFSEDRLFFSLAISFGINVTKAEQAIVYEEVVPARTTFWFKCYKTYCITENNYKLNFQKRQTWFQLSWKIIRKLMSVIEVPFLLLYVMFSPAFCNKRKDTIAHRFFQGCGLIAGILRLNPQYYKKTIGY